MTDKQSIIAMIPARIGSRRLKMKNLALLNGKPVISYAIKAAQESGIFDRIIVNSDSELLQEISEHYSAEFYLRPKHLGSSETKSDDAVFDFIQKHPCDIVAWVNPISPLQTGEEVRNVVQHFLDEDLDSLITVKNEHVHVVYENKPINFSIEGKFAQTQDLTPVQTFVYSVMMWKTKPFMRAMKKKGNGFFTGKVGYHPVNKSSAIIIKTEDDLRMVEHMLRSTSSSDSEIEYHKAVKNHIR